VVIRESHGPAMIHIMAFWNHVIGITIWLFMKNRIANLGAWRMFVQLVFGCI
jgi:hypothetical protein